MRQQFSTSGFNFGSSPLPPGIPDVGAYWRILESNQFREIEAFSNHFVNNHRSRLQDYAKKWVADPLHQWSRQWEYPFVLSHIRQAFSERQLNNVTILDAGSGLTFFPFYLASEFPLVRVVCCDRDQSLEGTFASIVENTGLPVKFSVADLHHLPYADESCDVVFSISVLEHTDAYDEIFREFHRVLKPGGWLLITFDVSLDKRNGIADSKARNLLETATQLFSPRPHLLKLAVPVTPSEESNAILTTKYVRRVNKKLLPWKDSRLTKIKKLVRKSSDDSLPNLTVFCQGLQK